jgi:predicted nuclease of predicted toxin-antitoxin system
MKLLFDENLSSKLPRILSADFPGSVRNCGLKGSLDEDIWEYAKVNSFIIISKDADFLSAKFAIWCAAKISVAEDWKLYSRCTDKLNSSVQGRYLPALQQSG